MKYLSAAIIGATVPFVVVTAAGAFFGSVANIAPCHCGASPTPMPLTWEQTANRAMFGAIVFIIYGGLPAAAIGAFAGSIVVWINSLSQDTRRPPE